MGNKQGKQAKEPKGGSAVRRRQKPGGRQDRPMSDPGIGAGKDLDNWALQSRDNTGRPTGGSGQRGGTSSIGLDAPDGGQGMNSDTQLLYQKCLRDVIEVWPEYSPLKDVDVSLQPDKVLVAMQQVYKRLFEQHSLISQLSKEKHDASLSLTEIQEERDSMQQYISSKQLELEAYKEDISILKGDLMKRGFDTKLPDRPEIADISLEDQYKEQDHKQQILKRVSAMGVPVLKAEEMKGHRRTGSNSLPIGMPGSPKSEESGYTSHDPHGQVEELNDKIKRLEAALDRERRQTSVMMERLDTSNPTSAFRGKPSGLDPDTLVRQYGDLEKEGLNNVLTVLTRHLGHTDVKRRYAFLGAIMEKAMKTAEGIMKEFASMVESLIINPTLPPQGGRKGSTDGAQELPLVKKFSASNKEKGPTKLDLRARSSAELPSTLMEQITQYVEGQSDIIDISLLIESVGDALSSEYANCTTAAVLNQATFTKFLHACCRLAWQLNTLDPPMAISIDTIRGFDESKHQTLETKGHPHSKIEFYVWPTLLSKQYGEVVHKGRVSIVEGTGDVVDTGPGSPDSGRKRNEVSRKTSYLRDSTAHKYNREGKKVSTEPIIPPTDYETFGKHAGKDLQVLSMSSNSAELRRQMMEDEELNRSSRSEDLRQASRPARLRRTDMEDNNRGQRNSGSVGSDQYVKESVHM